MKRYNTPHRSRVVKTRLTDEEYADFTERLLEPKCLSVANGVTYFL